MAHLVRQQKTFYVDRDGRRVPKGTPGAVKKNEKSAKWYGVGVPGYPAKKRFPLATDKAVARRMLDDLVRGAERGQAQLPSLDASRRSLTYHLADFENAVALGLASRSRSARRRPAAQQVGVLVQRLREVLDECGFKSAADLNAAAPSKLASYLDRRLAIAKRRDGGISQQTAQFYLSAARRFAWWLSTKAGLPVRADLFDEVPCFDPKSDRRHARRDVTPAELASILDAARSGGQVYRGLTGEDRYHLYLTAFATGFRVAELAALHPESFDLDGPAPVVVLAAKHTKNKKVARQPIPVGVANQLRPYLATKPVSKPVWGGTWVEKAAKMLRLDLAAAGVPYVVNTPEGPRYADFHALRHSYLSALASAGVGVKELQELARHSDPRLTLGIYTHVRPEALGASIALLQFPGGDPGDVFATMTRAELEQTAAGLLALLCSSWSVLFPSLVTPRVTPNLAIGGDESGQTETVKPKRCRKRAA